MPAPFDGRLVVAISSRALFDLEESNRVFEEQGVEAYYHYQRAHEDEILAPGIAFALVKKLLGLNALEHYRLDISRAAFTGGESTHPYVPAFDAHLFLSANPVDVRKALEAGHAAATILPSNIGQNMALTDQLRLAFDGDAVLFSDEAERVYKKEGLSAFTASEVTAAREPLS